VEFKDTGLPRHPAIEKAFAELLRFDRSDNYTSRGVLIAKLVADHGVHKDPESIAAGLLIPLAQDLGPFLCARADLPERVQEIIQSVFTFGAATMRGNAPDALYQALDPSVRAVVLASSARMFEVTGNDLAASLAARKDGDPPNATEENGDLRLMLGPIRHFNDMAGRVEKDELVLVGKCREQMQRITALLEGAGIKLPPAAKPPTPKP
jgi:hypothetical protein